MELSNRAFYLRIFLAMGALVAAVVWAAAGLILLGRALRGSFDISGAALLGLIVLWFLATVGILVAAVYCLRPVLQILVPPKRKPKDSNGGK